MCLLTLPEDLAAHILRTWLLDWRETVAWKLLAVLDVAVCRLRPKMTKLLREAAMGLDTFEVTGPGNYSLQRLRNISLFVQWIESRAFPVPWMRLAPDGIEELATADPVSFQFLGGFVLNLLADGNSSDDAQDARLHMLSRSMAEKLPNLAHVGLMCNRCSQILPRAVLEPVAMLRGSQILSLSLVGIDDALIAMIASSFPQLQRLEMCVYKPVTLDAILGLLQQRGGQLQLFKIGFAFEEQESSPTAPAWTRDAEVVREVLSRLTHPALRSFGWVECVRPNDLPCDVLLEALTIRPQLQRCEVGPHFFHIDRMPPNVERGRLGLYHVDGPALDRALHMLATLPHLALNVMFLQVTDSPRAAWLAAPSALAAFAQSHGRGGLREMHIVYAGHVLHAQPLPTMRLVRHLSALRSLRCVLQSRVASAESLARLLDTENFGDGGCAGGAEAVPLLTDLTLVGVGSLKDELLEQVLRGLPALNHLELRGCASISDGGLAVIASLCPDLRQLSVVGAACTTDLGRQSLATALPRCSVTTR